MIGHRLWGMVVAWAKCVAWHSVLTLPSRLTCSVDQSQSSMTRLQVKKGQTLAFIEQLGTHWPLESPQVRYWLFRLLPQPARISASHAQHGHRMLSKRCAGGRDFGVHARVILLRQPNCNAIHSQSTNCVQAGEIIEFLGSYAVFNDCRLQSFNRILLQAGEIIEFLVSEGEPVEYKQPVVVISPFFGEQVGC